MKKIFSLTLFLLLFSAAFSQNYSYSFDGELNQSTLSEIESKCLKFEFVSSAKIRYKEDTQKGELLIHLIIKGDKRAESDGQFKATDIKQIFLDSNLNPGEFRKLND